MPAEKHFVREKLKKGTHPKTKDVLADLDSADLFNATPIIMEDGKNKKT